MRTILAVAAVSLNWSVVEIATSRPADARIYCSHHYGCVEGKYARRPITGMTCRNATSKRVGHRYHFFCTMA